MMNLKKFRIAFLFFSAISNGIFCDLNIVEKIDRWRNKYFDLKEIKIIYNETNYVPNRKPVFIGAVIKIVTENSNMKLNAMFNELRLILVLFFGEYRYSLVVLKELGEKEFYVFVPVEIKAANSNLESDKKRLVSGLRRCSFNQIMDPKSSECYFMLKIKKIQKLNDDSENTFDFYDPKILDGFDNSATLNKAIQEYERGNIILLNSNWRYGTYYSNILNSKVRNDHFIIKNMKRYFKNFKNFLDNYDVTSSKFPKYTYSVEQKEKNKNNVTIMNYKNKEITYSGWIKREYIEKEFIFQINCNQIDDEKITKSDEIFNLSLDHEETYFENLLEIINLTRQGYKIDAKLKIYNQNGILKATIPLNNFISFFDFYSVRTNKKHKISLLEKDSRPKKYTKYKILSNILKISAFIPIERVRYYGKNFIFKIKCIQLKNAKTLYDGFFNLKNMVLNQKLAKYESFIELINLIKLDFKLNVSVVIENQFKEQIGQISIKCLFKYFEIEIVQERPASANLKETEIKTNHTRLFVIKSDKLIEQNILTNSQINHFNKESYIINATISTVNYSKSKEIFNVSLELTKKMAAQLMDIIHMNNHFYKVPIVIRLSNSEKTVRAFTNLDFLEDFYNLILADHGKKVILQDRAPDRKSTLFEIYDGDKIRFSRYFEKECLNGSCEKKIKIIVICTVVSILLVIIAISAAVIYCSWKQTDDQGEPNNAESQQPNNENTQNQNAPIPQPQQNIYLENGAPLQNNGQCIANDQTQANEEGHYL